MKPRHTIRVSGPFLDVCAVCGRRVGWVAFEAGPAIAWLTTDGPDERRRVVTFRRHLPGEPTAEAVTR